MERRNNIKRDLNLFRDNFSVGLRVIRLVCENFEVGFHYGKKKFYIENCVDNKLYNESFYQSWAKVKEHCSPSNLSNWDSKAEYFEEQIILEAI